MSGRMVVTMKQEKEENEPYMSEILVKEENDEFRIVLSYANFFLVEEIRDRQKRDSAEDEFYDIYGDEYYASVKDSIKLYQNGELVHEVDGETIIKWLRHGHGSTLFEQPYFLIFYFIMANFDCDEIVVSEDSDLYYKGKVWVRESYENALKYVPDGTTLTAEKGN